MSTYKKIARTSTVTLSGTMQMFRQGVSVRTWRQRFSSACVPKLYGGDPSTTVLSGSFGQPNNFFNDSYGSSAPGVFSNTAMETRLSYDMLRVNYGQSYTFTPGVPYTDVQGDTSGSMLLYMASRVSLEYPAIMSKNTTREQMDGVIEPLDIRRPIERGFDFAVSSSKDSAYHPRASVTSMYTETTYGNVEISQFVYNGTYPSRTTPFLDSQSVFITSSLPLPGPLMPSSNNFIPYIDNDEDEYKLRDFGHHDNEMLTALYALTGSTSDSMFPIDRKSAGAGFTYRYNPKGTDSIAFGGWFK